MDDLVDVMIKMQNNTEEFVGPVNTGNPGEYTIRELADIIIELTGSESKIV